MLNVPPHAALLRIAWRTLQVQRGESITYYVGSYSVVIEKAVLTRPVSGQVDTGENLAIETRSWDWLKIGRAHV